MSPNLSLVMELLGNVFTNFIFEKILSHEALVTGRITATSKVKRSFVSSYKWQKLFERYTQLRLFPKQILCQSYSRFKSFSLIQYDLWILWSAFLMEMFDLRGKEMNCFWIVTDNSYKILRLQDMWVELKL